MVGVVEDYIQSVFQKLLICGNLSFESVWHRIARMPTTLRVQYFVSLPFCLYLLQQSRLRKLGDRSCASFRVSGLLSSPCFRLSLEELLTSKPGPLGFCSHGGTPKKEGIVLKGGQAARIGKHLEGVLL